MRRTYRAGLSALAVTAVVGGTVAFKALDKSVDIVVDGKPQTVSTYASTVEGVLKDADITVKKRDSITPSPTSAVADGGKINLTRARMVDYNLDGAQNRQWVTALTVDEALDQLGVADNAKVSASRSQRIPLDGTKLEITTAKDITINVDGQVRQASSTSGDVQTLLTEQGITLEQQDTTDPALTSPITPGMIVKLRALGDEDTAAILEVILREEVAHVAAGSRWFRWHCERVGVTPGPKFRELLAEYARAVLHGPFNFEARAAAGFGEDELAALRQLSG